MFTVSISHLEWRLWDCEGPQYRRDGKTRSWWHRFSAWIQLHLTSSTPQIFQGNVATNFPFLLVCLNQVELFFAPCSRNNPLWYYCTFLAKETAYGVCQWREASRSIQEIQRTRWLTGGVWAGWWVSAYHGSGCQGAWAYTGEVERNTTEAKNIDKDLQFFIIRISYDLFQRPHVLSRLMLDSLSTCEKFWIKGLGTIMTGQLWNLNTFLLKCPYFVVLFKLLTK